MAERKTRTKVPDCVNYVRNVVTGKKTYVRKDSKMNELQKLERRLENTEKALFCLIGGLIDLQPPETQDYINVMMGEYFEANESLGFEHSTEFRGFNNG